MLVSREEDFQDASVFEDTGVFELYEQIFPNKEQRDDKKDIVRWVLYTDLGKKNFLPFSKNIYYRLQSRYFILTIGRKAIGLAFFTYDYSTNLIYGNYIAVQKCWRSGSLAVYFVRAIKKVLNSLFRRHRAVVFEVEPFDVNRIEEVINKLESRVRLTTGDLSEIRKLRRIYWYQEIGCFFFLDNTNKPVAIRAPSIDPTGTRSKWKRNEETFWIMWSGPVADDPQRLFRDAINCTYVEVLGKSLAVAYPRKAKEYWEYLNARISSNIKLICRGKVHLGPYLHKDRESKLYDRLMKLIYKMHVDIAI
jgi:hypothetical protein